MQQCLKNKCHGVTDGGGRVDEQVHGLNVTYEAPPGVTEENKAREDTEGETENKCEWQK